MKAFVQFLPVPTDDPNINALASTRTEQFTPANLATTVTLGNLPIADFTRVYKNGLRLASAAYSVSGKVVTFSPAANGTDVYLVDYSFRTN